MKRKILLFLTLLMFTQAVYNVSAVDYNFAGNEDYYSTLCSSAAAAKNVAVCTAYQEYVNQKVRDAEKALKDLQNELKNISSNILALAKKVNEYEAQITKLEKDIKNLEKSIKNSEAAILDLGIEIVARQKSIDGIDKTIKDRMIQMQSFVSLNSYIDFIMGAKDFSDLIIRVEGINDITQYDRDQMALLLNEVNALNADKAEVERQKEAQVKNMTNLESTQATVAQLKTSITAIISEYRKQEAAKQALAQEMAADIEATAAILKSISEALKNVPTSSGFIRPVSSFRISSGVWSYPEGGVHLGTDFANSTIGTTVKAVANGVVIYNSNSCPNIGYLGNTCGKPGRSGGGNQLYLMVSVNNKAYAIVYMHLMKDSVLPIGRIVDAGDQVARLASSGSSTGPHTHVEVIYLGTNTVGYYVNAWKGDLTFGTYNGTTGLNYRCDYNGHKPPCRENPQTIFNVVIGRYY
jgi:peptidoglycan hydrolase CwlO-like protein